MAKIFGNVYSGMIATARDLKGQFNVRMANGWIDILGGDNYRGFYYSVWRRYNYDIREWEFVPKQFKGSDIAIMVQEEEMVINGWEKVKDGFTKELFEEFRFSLLKEIEKREKATRQTQLTIDNIAHDELVGVEQDARY